MSHKTEVTMSKKIVIRGVVKATTKMATDEDNNFILDEDGRYVWEITGAEGSIIADGETIVSKNCIGANALDRATDFVNDWFASKDL